MKYADYIERVEIDSLWSGRKHMVWNLDRQVSAPSGVGGVGKSTVLNRMIKSLSEGGDFNSHLPKGVYITISPADATAIRYDIIRSFNQPLISSGMAAKVDIGLAMELDWQLFQLQHKYLGYQVNIGNRITEVLQKGGADAAVEAQHVSTNKLKFQNMVDKLFTEMGKTVIRTGNEIRLMQTGEKLLLYQLPSGEKQVLAILLTVLVEDRLPCVLLMDEPEMSLHVDWQGQLIDLIL